MRSIYHIYIFKNISNILFLPVKAFDPVRKLLEIDIFFVNEERFTCGTIPEHLKESSMETEITTQVNFCLMELCFYPKALFLVLLLNFQSTVAFINKKSIVQFHI